MKQIIAACGNDCSVCPRYLPKTAEELHKTAKLWYKIGYRDKVVSNNEIKCTGCKPKNWCRYQIIQCVSSRKIANCGQCELYPCEKISETFRKTMIFEPNCRKTCKNEEHEIMKKAFFEKKKNLDNEF
ncbi:MAG TPA: DUF3795 domain-containing protein [Pseudobacteroides sp.]|uniref:DUF3795 domain-containing protein n=1 Tax=Pseudobacteroides sp. TaxID=1968840 RepID=UPI002F925F10